MSILRSESFSDMFKAELAALGLEKFAPYKDPSGSYGVLHSDGTAFVYISTQVVLDSFLLRERATADGEIARALEPLRESILNSALFKEQQLELEKLRERVAELEPYETHYRMAFTLQNGKPSEGIV